MKHQLQIIGLQPGSLELPISAAEHIAAADVLTGGRRLLDAFPDFAGRTVPFKSPVSEYARTLGALLAEDKKVVLLADGDPLLFGIAESLIPLLGAENINVMPSISALQIGAARIGKGWKDFEILSLHGRNDYAPLFGALQRNADCAIYTDRINSPSRIASILTEKGVNNYRMTVLAELNTPTEIVAQGRPETFCSFECADLNIVLLTAEGNNFQEPVFGREDDSFIRQKGLITKLPVRAAGIALLDLRRGQTMWDLGAGCGSVAIEASFIGADSKIFAVEKDSERIRMIDENIRNFRAWTVEAVKGQMPQVLSELPDPDRIFIGGGIGRDDSVIRQAVKRLKPGGRIVVHAILMGSIQRTRETFDSLGWEWQSMIIQASSSDKLVGDIRYKAHNPVTIMWADKPEG